MNIPTLSAQLAINIPFPLGIISKESEFLPARSTVLQLFLHFSTFDLETFHTDLALKVQTPMQFVCILWIKFPTAQFAFICFQFLAFNVKLFHFVYMTITTQETIYSPFHHWSMLMLKNVAANGTLLAFSMQNQQSIDSIKDKKSIYLPLNLI